MPRRGASVHCLATAAVVSDPPDAVCKTTSSDPAVEWSSDSIVHSAGSGIRASLVRHSRSLLALMCVAVAIGCSLWWTRAREQGPVSFRVLGVKELGPTKTVSVECRWSGRLVVSPVRWKYQSRVSGCWREPSASPEFDATAFGARTNLQVFSFVVPTGTEACRCLLKYRVGSRYYCRGYGLLARSGLLQRFPKASVAALRWTLQQGATYDVAPVLELPAATDAPSESVAPPGG